MWSSDQSKSNENKAQQMPQVTSSYPKLECCYYAWDEEIK